MIVAYILGLLGVLFVLSGVVPRYREWDERLTRVREFESKYRTLTTAAGIRSGVQPAGSGASRHALDEWEVAGDTLTTVRPWLVARRNRMQADAESVGKGVWHVAPPPAIGGAFVPHQIFLDLFDEQSQSIGSEQVRLDDLATITHEVEWLRSHRKRDLFNPWAWLRWSFVNVLRFPAWVLRVAGFSESVTGSTGVRAVSVVWSLLVGGVTIYGVYFQVTHP